MEDIIEERAGWRVRLVPDIDPQEPDGDVQAYVIEVRPRHGDWSEGARTTVRHGKSMGLDLPAEVLSILEESGDGALELQESLQRAGHHADYTDWSGGYLFFVATPELRQAWGVAPENDTPENSLKGARAEWEAYRDGDVCGYVIEREERWLATSFEGERYTWESEDSCFGYYGRAWAEEAAREAFAHYAPEVKP